MINMDELDDDVLEAIVNNMDIDTGEEEDLHRIKNLSVYEAFDRYLMWQGIIGYTTTIMTALDNIRKAGEENEVVNLQQEIDYIDHLML